MASIRRVRIGGRRLTVSPTVTVGGGGAPPPTPPVLVITNLTGLTEGGTSTVTLSFSNGAPVGLSAQVDGLDVVESNVTIGILSGSGATASGTASFDFPTPLSGPHSLIVQGTGTYAATTPSPYNFTTAATPPPDPVPSLTVTALTGLTPGGTSTVTLGFANGLPASVVAKVDGLDIVESGIAINTVSGSGATAAGTVTFSFPTPAAGPHTLSVSSTGTYATTAPNYSFTPFLAPPVDSWDAVTPFAAVTRGYYNAGSVPLTSPFVQSFHFAQRGDIPSGTYPALFNGASQIQTQVDLTGMPYPDGSWSCGGLTAIIPATLAANGSAGDAVTTYQIKPVSGSPPATPKFSLATWAAANDVRIMFRTNFLNQADDANNWEFKISDCIAAGIVRGVGTGSGYPLYSYQTLRSGPVCMEWMFEGFMRRKSDGAYHTQLKCRIYVLAVTLTDMLIKPVLRMPNSVDTQATNPLQTVGPTTGSTIGPMTGIAELIKNSAIIHRWGGPTDFRAVTFTPTVTDVSNNTTVSTVDTVANQIVFPDATTHKPRNAVGYVFSSTGTLPGGLTAGQVNWTINDFYNQRVYLETARGFTRGAGSTMHSWTAGATATFGNAFFDSYVVGAVGNYRTQQRWFAVANGVFGSTPPTGTAPQLNGTVQLLPMNVVLTSQGTGTLSAYPVVHVFPLCEAHLADETTAGRIWTGSGPNPLVNNLIDLTYHMRYARAFPPYDLTIPTIYTNDLAARWNVTKYSVGEPSFQSQIDNFGDDPGTNLVGWLNYTNTSAMLAQRDPTAQKQARSEALRWTDHWTLAEDQRSGMPVVSQTGLGNVPGVPYPGLGVPMTSYNYNGTGGQAGQFLGFGKVPASNWYDAKYARLVDGSHLPATWIWQYHSTGDAAYLEMGMDLATAVVLCQSDNNIGRTWTYNGRKYCSTIAIFNQIRGMGWSIRCLDSVYDVLPASHPCRALITDQWNDTQDAAVGVIDYNKNNDPTVYSAGLMFWIKSSGPQGQFFFQAICLLAAAQAARKAWGTAAGFRTMCEHVGGRYFLPLFDDAGVGNAGMASWNEGSQRGNCQVMSVKAGDVITMTPQSLRIYGAVPFPGMPTGTYTVPVGATPASVAQALVAYINSYTPFTNWGMRARYEDTVFFNTRMPDLMFDETRIQMDGCLAWTSSGTGTVIQRAPPIWQFAPMDTNFIRRGPPFPSTAAMLEHNCGTGWPKSRTVQLCNSGNGTGGTGNGQLPFSSIGWFPWGCVDYYIFVNMAVATMAEAGIQGPAAQGTGSTTAQIANAIEARFQTAKNGPPRWSGSVGGKLGSGTRTYPNFNIRTWAAQAKWPSPG